jgi:hypothetical protein
MLKIWHEEMVLVVLEEVLVVLAVAVAHQVVGVVRASA